MAHLEDDLPAPDADVYRRDIQTLSDSILLVSTNTVKLAKTLNILTQRVECLTERIRDLEREAGIREVH